MERVHHQIELSPDPSSAAWAVSWLELEEALDEPFVLRAELRTQDTTLDLDALVGVDFVATMERGVSERRVAGIVQRAAYAGTHHGRLHVRVTVVPAWALLGHSRRSRCFHGLSVPEIVAQVVRDELSRFERRVELGRLTSTYGARDLCTQFRESDLEFVTRILAEEGITLAWDHTEAHELAVLLDDNASFVPLDESLATARTGLELPIVGVLSGAARAQEGVTSAGWAREITPAGFSATAWDWRPSTPEWLVSESPRATCSARVGSVELRECRRLVESDGGVVDHTLRVAELRRAAAAANVRAELQSNLLHMQVGHTFALDGHPHPDLDREYVVVRALHRFEPGADVADDEEALAPDLVSDVVCQPLALAYRPKARTRPEVPGTQMGTVVGPVGEEVHTDVHGRVLVRMGWGGEEPTCYARVASAWAGAGFGALTIPRVGMEVVVSFVDGDPDRPLVTGCVYNGANLPPVALPDSRTQTTLRTRSTPTPEGAVAGFNELRFEDAAGGEEVYLHAQRNLTERVLSTHRTSVGHTQHLSVGKKRFTTVAEEDKLEVDGSIITHALTRHSMIGDTAATSAVAAEKLTVTGKCETDVDGEWSLRVQDVSAGPPTLVRTLREGFAVDAQEEIRLTVVGGSSLVITRDSIELTSKSIVLKNPAGASITVAGEVAVSSPDRVSLTKTQPASGPVVPQCSLVLEGQGACLWAAASVDLKTDAGAAVELTDAAAVRGTVVGLHPLAQTTSIVAAADRVEINAPGIAATATGPMILQGKPISLN